MNGKIHPALLPAGLQDTLPPDAEFESEVTEGLIAAFAAHGYERVKPPLIEFEENLISGSGAATAAQTFRLMDPVSQRMLGLRADMTLQIARIATTRLADLPRPLRLSYAGQVLRVVGSALRPERQFGQVGAELIGSASCRADAEVILMAANTLKSLGVSGLSIDLGLPLLVSEAIKASGPKDEGGIATLNAALAQKDAAAIAAIDGVEPELFAAILDAAGHAEEALERLRALSLPAEAKVQIESQIEGLAEVMTAIKADAPGLKLTIDPVEMRGYEYHEGVTFSIFAVNLRGELGRGGRYRSGNGEGDGEPSTGFTLFVDTLLRALPTPVRRDKVYLPAAATLADAIKLRTDGWATIQAMDDEDGRAEALRLGCTHIFEGGSIHALKQD
ncbi:MAG: ATP phosphoribosyltransferase regulatory subunit [Rhodospirillaceae bacterium]|jgi:ATP phosphoribosyltransferase regulatory subunit|nr:ATP phosphoribosyltransferase regulatory subunit [Rhodospirillaceae bacterium]MBT4116254.1 ATP phosphoribosyltransferase regulatory subunit [Rhodospirillaceae bacterium]MBT4673918.1 ATP phosphoribosyltransferase regulatory subunit [Rhodospirillaceae bacterium]MBT4719974.1 ATP phosphoribosyltransferase regulatory subunit [Rhodospirillaceae bacterium]MBT4748482.1 ATP phosphoribosyltransferase regulatory subunit [Rhodospirillaceae bacterium]